MNERSYPPQEKRFLRHILNDSGIEGRHLVLQLDAQGGITYRGKSLEEASTARRNHIFACESPALAEEATRNCLSATHTDPAEITHLITVTCTGFTNPGLDIDIIECLGMSPNIKRFTLGFMGCYAAIPALDLARSIIESQPSAQVLIVCAELCSLHFQPHAGREALLAATLFADGVAAAHLSAASSPNRFALGESFSRIIPGSLEHMAWTVGDHGFDLRLSPYVSKLVGANLSEALPRDWQELTPTRHWAVHPGGRSILDKVEGSLDLSTTALRASRKVFRKYGNLSSATLLFVLKEIIDQHQLADRDVIQLLGFGPGLTAYGIQIHSSVEAQAIQKAC